MIDFSDLGKNKKFDFSDLSGSQKVNDSEDNDSDENLLQKVMRYGIKDPAIGVLEGGRELANLPNKLSKNTIPEFSPSKFNFDETLGLSKPNQTDEIIQSIFQYLPSLGLPAAKLGKAGELIGSIPKAGRFAKRIISEAIPQALYSAAQAPSGEQIKSGATTGAMMAPFSILGETMKSTSPLVRNLAKALSGIGSGYLGREGAKAAGMGETGSDITGIAAGALGARGFNTKKDMMRKLTEGVNPKLADERLAAANRLKLDYLTPAEAGVSPWASKQQGSLGRTAEGGKMLYEKGHQRVESEKQAINKTLDMIYKEEKNGPEMAKLYKEIEPVILPQEFTGKYNKNVIIKAAKDKVESSPAYKEELKNIPKDSLVYWDHVKRGLDDMVQSAERRGDSNEARILSNTTKKMREDMDLHYPEYANARALYERKATREGLESVFDRKEITGRNFYQAIASQNKFDELMHHLRNAPEAAENLKDMRLIFKDLMGPPTILTAKGLEERHINESKSTGAYLQNLFENIFTKGVNDKAAIDFITSKDWNKQLKEINKISDKQMKLIALSLSLGKGVSQYAGTATQEVQR